MPQPRTSRARTVRASSHLSAPNYCLRFRPRAQAEADDTLSLPVGFRSVIRVTSGAGRMNKEPQGYRTA